MSKQIPEEKLKEWRDEFIPLIKHYNGELSWSKDPYWCKYTHSFLDDQKIQNQWEVYLAAKTSSYEREQKYVEALRDFIDSEVLNWSEMAGRQELARLTLKELGYDD